MQAQLTRRASLVLLAMLIIAGYGWRIAGQTSPAGHTDQAAAEAAADGGVSVPANRSVTDDLVTAGPTVRVQSDIGGDVAAAGGDVTIDGSVTGYVMSAGRNVTLEGPIGNDLWAAGERVNVSSEIGNNAMVAGRVVHLQRGTIVGHDAHLAGNTVTSEGRVQHNLKIGADTARIGGDIGGGVEARAERVSVLPGAVIHGDLVVRAPQPPDISTHAQILGEVRYEKVAPRSDWLVWPRVWFVGFAALLMLGVAAIAMSPAWPARVASTIRVRTVASIVSGFFFLAVIPVIIAALAMTVVGLPLALTVLGVYTIILLLSSVFVSYRIGEWLSNRTRFVPSERWARMVLGALIVSLAISLPLVGWVFAVIVLATGTGAILLERGDQRARLQSLGLA